MKKVLLGLFAALVPALVACPPFDFENGRFWCESDDECDADEYCNTSLEACEPLPTGSGGTGAGGTGAGGTGEGGTGGGSSADRCGRKCDTLAGSCPLTPAFGFACAEACLSEFSSCRDCVDTNSQCSSVSRCLATCDAGRGGAGGTATGGAGGTATGGAGGVQFDNTCLSNCRNLDQGCPVNHLSQSCESICAMSSTQNCRSCGSSPTCTEANMCIGSSC